MSQGILMGNLKAVGMLTVPVDVGSVGAVTSIEVDVNIPGLLTGDFVAISKPSHEAGLIVSTARVKSNGVMAFHIGNITAGAIDPGEETYTVMWMRPATNESSVKE